MSRSNGESFVLWLDREVRAGFFAGEVEHVSSSRRLRFATIDELAAFLLEAAAERSRSAASTPGASRIDPSQR